MPSGDEDDLGVSVTRFMEFVLVGTQAGVWVVGDGGELIRIPLEAWAGGVK